MVDFRKHMPPEQRERLDREQAYLAKERAELQASSIDELVAKTKRYIANSEGPHKYPAGVPVYDNAMWHIVLPELLRRLEGLSKIDESLVALREEHLKLRASRMRCSIDPGDTFELEDAVAEVVKHLEASRIETPTARIEMPMVKV